LRPLDPVDWLPLSRLWRVEARLRRRAIGALLARPELVRRLARHRPDAEPRTAALLALADLLGEGELAEGPPARARESLLRSLAAVEAAAPADVTVRDFWIAGRRARRFEPPGISHPTPALLFFHGGGFVTGGLESHEGLCRRLASDLDAVVIAFDYRLAPEHRFPAAVDDAWTAWRWLVREAERLGLDHARLAVGGDSAGGNLSAVVSRRAAERDEPAPVAQLLLYPALDFTRSLDSHRRLAKGWFLTAASIDWYLAQYLPRDVDPSIVDLSPLLHPVPKGLSPAVIATAGKDPLVDEGVAYAQALDAAGVAVDHAHFPELIHGFALMGQAVPATLEALAQVTESLRRRLHPSSGPIDPLA
jgi:acetyl esterase